MIQSILDNNPCSSSSEASTRCSRTLGRGLDENAARYKYRRCSTSGSTIASVSIREAYAIHDGIAATNVQFSTKVCTYIFTQQGRYAELLQCYLDDSAHPHSVFDALQDLLRDTSGSDYETVRSWFEKSLNVSITMQLSLIADLQTLTNVDAYRTAEIVSENLTDLLADAKSLPFDLIRSCFEMR